MAMDPDLRITRTTDLQEIWELCKESGLDMKGGPLKDIVVAYGCYVDGEMLGCATLQEVEGSFFLEYVAVAPDHRLKGIGRLLVREIEEEARSRGLEELWAKARSPGFYESIGFRIAPQDEETPKSLDGCIGCQQLRVTCFPAIVVKQLRTRSSLPDE
ncbi:TPA: GNAT family N-acetyltransferase [Thermoplasmata archaeon]|nr:GNAT family N-acetyltransferase [Thermoplasmata archaeon]